MDRRTFLSTSAVAAGAAATLELAEAAPKSIVGLELYTLREDFAKDMDGVLKAVAKMGYKGVEFYGPYAEWKPEKAKETRKLIDDLGLVCCSAHTGAKYFTPDQMDRVIELNVILGSKYMIMSSAGKLDKLDAWKGVAAKLNMAAEKLRPLKKGTGFHNHALEFRPIEGMRPIELLAKETPKDVVLQLDVGTCVEAESDPVAWIHQNAGRIRSIHLKDWKRGLPNPHDGYRVVLGDGSVDWKAVLTAAKKKGGTEHYLIEQEGGDFTPMFAAEQSLKSFLKWGIS
jgi:sugar phosphate isomerase/epimerase